MLGNSTADWRATRRAAATSDIVAAAWELAREHGLSGLSLRDLARRLGMAAPSLYSYVESKNALYDAMFADGYRAWLALEPPADGPDLRTVLRSGAEQFVEFSTQDPVRFMLLFQRTIPGFEPSPESWALAQQVYDRSFEPLRRWADLTQHDLDLVSACITGLISQQVANDPGGSRWVDLLDDAVDLLLPRIQSKATKPSPARGRTSRKEKP
ncbi:MAG TPA: TetR/AcrR family transcriptional regulator [Mycobacteriales bacterium]|nr:TetR/AcrR family transcriptional regulator [Mycobacteriales bacterium]